MVASRRTLHSSRHVPEPHECLEIPSGPAPEIQYRERRVRLDVLQERREVLTDPNHANLLPKIATPAVR